MEDFRVFLEQQAPLLLTYGPLLLAIVLGYMLGKSRASGSQDAERPKAPLLRRSSSELLLQESNDASMDVFEDAPHVPYQQLTFSPVEMEKRSWDFYQLMDRRRSVRFFSDKPVPREVIDNIIRTAG